MNFAPAFFNIHAHGTNNTRQFICSNMGMGVVQNIFFGAKTDKEIENALNITSLITTGIQFAVTVGACPPSPKQ